MNPRSLPNHRERGAGIILKATWQDIAALLGLSVHTAKKLGCGAHRRFDPHDLRDVVRFALEYQRQRRAEALPAMQADGAQP